MIITRNTCESELIQALSRYIGYTTGAYDIIRIADLSFYFNEKPSLLEIELCKIIQTEYNVKNDYATGIINFCCSLGFITRHTQGGRLAKLSISSLGRAYCAAHNLEKHEFKRFLLSYSVLQNDADIYGVLLSILSMDKSLQGEKLHKAFLAETLDLRKKRIKWLNKAFPNQVLRDRIAKKILWINSSIAKEIRTLDPKMDFARHHSSPRKGWAQKLGHISESGEFTDSGRNIINKLAAKDGKYFWLGPPKECFEILRISKDYEERPFSPAWNVLRPAFDEICMPVDIAEEIAEYMVKSYPFLRLVNYNQAPIEAVLPYVYFIEHKENLRINEKELLTKIFSDNKNKFALMSKRNDIFGHYQLRKFS